MICNFLIAQEKETKTPMYHRHVIRAKVCSKGPYAWQ